MNADDISEYLARIKEAEEVGLTPAEIWRTEENVEVYGKKFQPGDRVTFNGGFPGTVVRYYSKRMVEIRGERGMVCIDEVDANRTDLERCARCKRETAPENGYKTGAGFFCGPCSSEYDDGVK